MASKTKSTLILAAKILVAAGLIVFMVNSGYLDPKNLWAMMTFKNVVFALLIIGLNTFVSAWRWIILMRARGLNVTLWYGFSLYLIGIFFNYALPGSVGGDVVRGYYLMNDYPGRRADTILSIFIDRILGLYSFFILTLMAAAMDLEFVLAHEKIRIVALFCLIVFAGMTAFFTVTFSSRLSALFGLGYFERKIPTVHKLVEAVQRYGDNPKMIAISIAVSLFGQLIAMLFFYQVALISGAPDITWKAVMFAVPMGFLVSAIPLAPGGIGVGQVAFHYLFAVYLNRETEVGATAITAFQLTLVCWAFVGAVLYLRRKRPVELEQLA